MIRYPELGIGIPKILLPDSRLDYSKWSVVACDQFTSQPEYWEATANLVANHPSALHLIFPEVYLGKDDEARIEEIHRHMEEYLKDGVVTEHGPCMIYVERRIAGKPPRKGLVLAVDLEAYDYTPGAHALIRATEGTVLERIPPRVKIRDGALLELPHVMLLIDDPTDNVIGPISEKVAQLQKLYHFQLMQQGGELTGYQVDQPQLLAEIVQALKELASPQNFNQKYGLHDAPPLLFAVGDGNHSLATAKAVWEKTKTRLTDPADLECHPARYALVEVVNIHDPALKFEPIHRVLFNVAARDILGRMSRFFNSHGMDFMYRYFNGEPETVITDERRLRPESHFIGFITSEGHGLMEIAHPTHQLEVGTLQMALDALLKDIPGAAVDYIHGESVVTNLGSRPGNMGFYLPSMDKSALFKTVILDGVLPRKTFSMGEAREKRYYMECRKITF